MMDLKLLFMLFLLCIVVSAIYLKVVYETGIVCHSIYLVILTLIVAIAVVAFVRKEFNCAAENR